MRFFLSSLKPDLAYKIQTAISGVSVNVLRAFGTDESETAKLIHATMINEHGVNVPLVAKENLILDSGAWTLNQRKNKRKINKEVYAKYLIEYGDRYLFYMNLDEVFADEGNGEFDDKAIATNLVNQEYLEAQGLRPVPVIHSLDDAEIDFYIKRKAEYNHEYIAIGSTQAKKKKSNELTKAIDKLYDAGYKIHLFGIGSYDDLKGQKIWSCDASSYAQWAISGRVVYYSEIKQKEVVFSFLSHDRQGNEDTDFIYSKPPELITEYEEAILKPLNLSIEDLFVNESSMYFANAYYYILLEKMLTDIQINMGITFDRW